MLASITSSQRTGSCRLDHSKLLAYLASMAFLASLVASFAACLASLAFLVAFDQASSLDVPGTSDFFDSCFLFLGRNFLFCF